MTAHDAPTRRPDPATTHDMRRQLTAALPVKERTVELAGVSTVVLEGGEGPPIVFLHGPGEHAVKWLRIVPELTRTHRVVLPDLPGHGASEVVDGELSAEQVIAWLGELIESTCAQPPVLVGQIVGGAIAARFAAASDRALDRLVLVDALGLAPFAPDPAFGQALEAWVAGPDDDTFDGIWRYCAFDVEALRGEVGAAWDPLKHYTVDRLQTPGVQTAMQALMASFGFPAIPDEELSRIDVDTTLIWGRDDLATPLAVAHAAATRYGWPLHVIDDCGDDPPMERPAEFLAALRTTLRTAHPTSAVR